MTPIEVRKAAQEFNASCGSQSSISIFVSDDKYSEHALMFSLWPDGMLGKCAFRVTADTFEELFEKAEAAWKDRRADYEAKTTRAMALEIIRLTADHGECTDAALRATFSVEEVARFGKAAVKDANSIASNGPFAISMRQSMKGANAA